MRTLDELSEIVRRLERDIGPAVVGVGRRWSVGSGIVIGADQIVTNAHNLSGDEPEIVFGDGRRSTGTVAGADIDGDVAVVSVDTQDAPVLEWREDGDALSIGTPVFALANPGGMGLRVSFGLVTGTQRSFRGPRGRRIGGSIEHTSPLLPGSSGGPIVDSNGKLLGINTNRLGEGFYLAIPADADLRERLKGMEKGEVASRPRLGVGIAPSHVAARLRRAVGLPEVEGLLVRLVEDDSPAARAGVSEGDLIVEAAGEPLASADQLHDLLDRADAGTQLDLKLLRGTEERSVSVSFAS